MWLQLTEGIEVRGRANWKLAGARRAALMPPDHTGHLTTLIVAHSASTTQGGNPSFLQILGEARSSVGGYIRYCIWPLLAYENIENLSAANSVICIANQSHTTNLSLLKKA